MQPSFGAVPTTESLPFSFGVVPRIESLPFSFATFSPGDLLFQKKIDDFKTYLASFSKDDLMNSTKFNEFIENLKKIPNYYIINTTFDCDGKKLSFAEYLLEKEFYKLIPYSIRHRYCEKQLSQITKHIRQSAKNNTVSSYDLFNIMREISECQSLINKSIVNGLEGEIADLKKSVEKNEYMLNKYFKVNFRHMIDSEYERNYKKRNTNK